MMSRLGCLLLMCLGWLNIAEATSPNIVLILTDDHGWSQLATTMDPRVPEAKSDYLETPHMTSLIEGGMRFSDGYSPAPLCTPTRRSILCGTSAGRSGPEFRSEWVPAEHLTIPKVLKAANADYRCAHFGKWGEQMISTPEECGYDVSDGMTGNITGGMPNSLGMEGGHGAGPAHFIDNVDAKRTKSITARAMDFMREQSSTGKPFYVQVSYYAQHLSVVTTDEMLAKYEAKGTPDRGYTPAWAAMMEELDNGIGRLLRSLEEIGVDENTYVFLTADNGGRGKIPGGDESRVATNFPLTGSKHSLYEGGIRVPFIVKGPGVKAGSVCHEPVVGYDFLPTFCELAGGNLSLLTSEVDGVSFAQLLTNPDRAKLERPAGGIVFHYPARLFSAIRNGDHKLMLFWKRNGDVARSELYDLSTQPTEEGHQVMNNAKLSEQLQAKLTSFLESVDAEKAGVKEPKRKRN